MALNKYTVFHSTHETTYSIDGVSSNHIPDARTSGNRTHNARVSVVHTLDNDNDSTFRFSVSLPGNYGAQTDRLHLFLRPDDVITLRDIIDDIENTVKQGSQNVHRIVEVV